MTSPSRNKVVRSSSSTKTRAKKRPPEFSKASSSFLVSISLKQKLARVTFACFCDAHCTSSQLNSLASSAFFLFFSPLFAHKFSFITRYQHTHYCERLNVLDDDTCNDDHLGGSKPPQAFFFFSKKRQKKFGGHERDEGNCEEERSFFSNSFLLCLKIFFSHIFHEYREARKCSSVLLLYSYS